MSYENFSVFENDPTSLQYHQVVEESHLLIFLPKNKRSLHPDHSTKRLNFLAAIASRGIMSDMINMALFVGCAGGIWFLSPS